jgi:(p)ppGpp synthase/HD superfamily hydrolase
MNKPSSTYNTGLIFKALAFAAHKHRDQRRKDVKASPYINHPIALADVLCNEGGITDENVLCTALLHDTVEDTETTPEELTQVFGKAMREFATNSKAEDIWLFLAIIAVAGGSVIGLLAIAISRSLVALMGHFK